jgi:hypothetical protein
MAEYSQWPPLTENQNLKKKNTTFLVFLFVSIIYNLSSAENQTSSIKYSPCHPFFRSLHTAARGGRTTRPPPATPLVV